LSDKRGKHTHCDISPKELSFLAAPETTPNPSVPASVVGATYVAVLGAAKTFFEAVTGDTIVFVIW
jgi:hypothetical protein